MTTNELARGIAEETGLTQLRSNDLIRRTRDAFLWSVVSEGRIELRRFGVSLGMTPPDIGLVTDLEAQVVEPARLADDLAHEPAGTDHHVGKVRRRERVHRPSCRPTRRRPALARGDSTGGQSQPKHRVKRDETPRPVAIPGSERKAGVRERGR
jgi:hypothetical protein